MSRSLGRLLGLLVAVCGACGGGDDNPPVPDSAPGTPDAGPGAPDAGAPDAAGRAADAALQGTLTIEASGITGAMGKIALVMVMESGGGPILGGICVPITADPGSFSDVAKTPTEQGNPCALGADVVFANGSYDLLGGIYTPGSMTPEQCSTTTVDVVGDTVVTMPAFGACN
jgi:hypothetical protein